MPVFVGLVEDCLGEAHLVEALPEEVALGEEHLEEMAEGLGEEVDLEVVYLEAELLELLLLVLVDPMSTCTRLPSQLVHVGSEELLDLYGWRGHDGTFFVLVFGSSVCCSHQRRGLLAVLRRGFLLLAACPHVPSVGCRY